MIRRVLSRPLTRLAVLAFTILALSNTDWARAAEPLTAPSALTRLSNPLQVDSQMLPALLPPMSHLVQSPYADARSLENPLGIELKAPSQSDAIRAVVIPPATKPLPTPTAMNGSSVSASFQADAPELASPFVRNPPLTFTPMLSAPPAVKQFPVRQEPTFGLSGSVVVLGR